MIQNFLSVEIIILVVIKKRNQKNVIGKITRCTFLSNIGNSIFRNINKKMNLKI